MTRPKPPPTAAEVIAFLDDLRVLHAPILPIFGARKVLTFMGTTSWPGRAPALAVRRVAAITATPGEGLRLTIEGRLPRPVEPGERVAVSLTDSARFFGFQLKTPVLTDADRLDRLAREVGGNTELVGSQVFTVHPTEYTTRFFEDVPVADVVALADQLRFALLAIGAQANVSPRFVFHHESDGKTVSLFHGDSALNKTHLNLQSNDREARLVVDLGRLSGLVLEGTVAPFTAEEHPKAAAAITAGFEAAGLGAPRRLYHLRAERWAWTDAGRP